MNEELDKVIQRYVYNEFGQEFGDVIVDLKHLQYIKTKKISWEYCENYIEKEDSFYGIFMY